LQSLSHGDQSNPSRRRVFHAAFSEDGEQIISISEDGTFKMWEASSGRPIPVEVRHGAQASHAALSRSGHFVVTAGKDGVARVWDVRKPRPDPQAFNHGTAIFFAGFSPDPDGERLFTASSTHFMASSNEVRIWNRQTGELIGSLISRAAGTALTCIALSPDGAYLATVGDDGNARFWPVADGTQNVELKGHSAGIIFLNYDRTGRRIVTTSRDATARIWDAASGKTLAALPHKGQVNHAAWSADG